MRNLLVWHIHMCTFSLFLPPTSTAICRLWWMAVWTCWLRLLIICLCFYVWVAYMPTLPDYLGVSRIRHQSPGLPYGSLYLPDKIIFWAFMCLSLKFSPFLAQNLNFLIRNCSTVSEAFYTYLVTDKDYFWHQNDDREFG